MYRLLALLVALGLLVAADRSRSLHAREDEKKKDEKKEEKKEDKKKEDKKKEVKLTDEQKKELKAMSGKFTVVTFERGGEKATAAALKAMAVEQNGEKWKYTDAEGATEGTDVVYPDKSPKEIDSTYTTGTEIGKTAKGIYKIEDDTITYCWSEPGQARPKEFSGKGKGLTMMVIKRVKEAKKEKKEEKKKDE